MKIAVILQACLLACLAAVAHAEAPFTPEEKAQVETMTSNIANSCLTQMTAMLEQTKRDGNPAPVEELLRPEEYCGCIGTGLRAAVTPALLRENSNEKGRQLGEQVAYACAAEGFRKGFPTFCRRLVADASSQPGAKESTPEQREAACSCVQERVDRLDGTNVHAMMTATMRDYEQWRREHVVPTDTGEGSLLGPMMACFESNGVAHRPASDALSTPPAAPDDAPAAPDEAPAAPEEARP
jgi:hypothetical protein